MAGSDEWTTVRRRRNVVDAAEQAKALKRLPIPVVPLAFSALDIEENAIQKAQEAAEAEKRRLRRERQRNARATEQAQRQQQQEQQQQQQQQQRHSTTTSTPGTTSARSSSSDAAGAQPAGPFSGLLALLAAIFGVGLVRQLIEHIQALLGLGRSRSAKRRKQPAMQAAQAQSAAAGKQLQQDAKAAAQSQPQPPSTASSAKGESTTAGASGKVQGAARGVGASIIGAGATATAAGASQNVAPGRSGPADGRGASSIAAVSKADQQGATAGSSNAAASAQAAAPPRNAKPSVTLADATKTSAPAPAKPACDSDWARGRFLVTENPSTHADVISSLALSGEVALSSGYDGSIKVWHWPVGGPVEHVRNLTGHSGRVEAVVLEPATAATARRAASTGRDSTLKVWDLGLEGRVAAASYYVYESVRCMAADWSSGSAALGCQSGTVALFDLERGRKLQAIKGAHADEVCCLLHSATGAGGAQQLISGSRDACVAVWDTRSSPAASIATFEGLQGRVCSLSTAGHLLYVGDYSSTVKVFDLRQGSQLEPALRVPNVPSFAGDACPVAGLHSDAAASIVVSSGIGWWTANKQALEEAPQDAGEPIACLNVHAACKPDASPASATTSVIPKHEYLYTLRLCPGIATCLAAGPGSGSAGTRMLLGTSNGTLLAVSLVKGSGNRVQLQDGVSLEEALPIGVEELPDDEEGDSSEDDG